MGDCCCNSECCVRQTCCAEGCDKPAEWCIVHGTAPDDYTEACTEHVGQLLTDSSIQYIYPIHQEVPA